MTQLERVHGEAQSTHLDVVDDLLEHVVEVEDAASRLGVAATAKPAARAAFPLPPLFLALLLLRLSYH